MITAFALCLVLPAQTPTSQQLDLLRIFRNEFVELTPGKGRFPRSFSMGGDPPRKMEFDDSFQIARYEVPQNLWEAVSGSNPSRWKGPRNSVEMVSFNEALQFCERATQLMRSAELIKPDEVIRLPTEAEWEYAARAGTDTVYSFGDDSGRLDDYAWHAGNARGNDPPVGAKRPNPWGLYDMHGYLWEWCSDTWRRHLIEGDQERTERSPRRVIRGGSWKDPAERLTSRTRDGLPPDTRDDAVGFRCLLAKTESK